MASPLLPRSTGAPALGGRFPGGQPLGGRSLVVAVVVAGALLLGACGGDGSESGLASAQEVVDAHVAAGLAYDLAAGCELRSPVQIAQMASFDGVDADGYCEGATAEVVARADDETRARSRAIYAGAVVVPIDRPGGSWFRITSADGSYEEEVEVIELDGRWYLGDIEVHLHDEDDGHDHEAEPAHEDDDHDEGAQPLADGPSG